MMQTLMRMFRFQQRNVVANPIVNSIRLNHESKSSVVQNEVEFLSNLADNWWDPSGPVGPLHSMNMVRVPLIRDGLISTNRTIKENMNSSRPLKNVNILEVGCGAGILTEALARIEANVVGLDPSEPLIKTARDHLLIHPPDSNLSKRIEYRNETIEQHSLENKNKYDAVVVSEVIEHVDDKMGFIKSCVDALAPGGSIFITTLNKSKLSWFCGILMAEYVLRLIPAGTHDWNKFISPLEMQRLLDNCGCTTVLCNGLFYDFIRNRWNWIPVQQVSYALHAVKL